MVVVHFQQVFNTSKTTLTLNLGISVSRMWLENGDIVLIADTQGIRDIVSTESSSVVDVSTPLTVLINHGTASASEVLQTVRSHSFVM